MGKTIEAISLVLTASRLWPLGTRAAASSSAPRGRLMRWAGCAAAWGDVGLGTMHAQRLGHHQHLRLQGRPESAGILLLAREGKQLRPETITAKILAPLPPLACFRLHG